MAQTAQTTDRAVREPERQRITGVSRPGWYLAERRGVVPRRRQQRGLRACYWLESELLAWLRGEWRPDQQSAGLAPFESTTPVSS